MATVAEAGTVRLRACLAESDLGRRSLQRVGIVLVFRGWELVFSEAVEPLDMALPYDLSTNICQNEHRLTHDVSAEISR